MAQWSRADRTIYTKLVYYGPAFGGKTTNLKALHAISDPRERSRLLSLETADDRTLFFDLLPFELGDILGYRVVMKLFTVPGQVKYDITRQVVLTGTDAIVFVADSTNSRREQNVWSLQNLRMNMRARRIDPSRVPVLYQFNKQDRNDAAAPAQVAKWLGLKPAEQGHAAVALNGQGVVETFLAASRAMLLRLIATVDECTRREIDVEQLSAHLDRAFAPHLQRAGSAAQDGATTLRRALDTPRVDPIVLADGDLVERAIEAGVRLGESASAEQSRADRLERETEALRALSEALQRTGASFDAGQIIDAVLSSSREILRASAVTLLRAWAPGEIAVERSWGHPDDPLCRCAEGRELLAREWGRSSAHVVSDLNRDLPSAEARLALSGLGTAAMIPVGSGEERILIAYLPSSTVGFRREDVRFLVTVAGHLAVGLEKARLHRELAAHRDRLEAAASVEPREPDRADDASRGPDHLRLRLASRLLREISVPLGRMASLGRTLQDHAGSARERRELVTAWVASAESLQRQFDQLPRLIELEEATRPLAYACSPPDELLTEALNLVGLTEVSRIRSPHPLLLCGDRALLIRALVHVIDDAVRCSPVGSTLEITAQQGRLATVSGGSVATVEFSVCDPCSERFDGDEVTGFDALEQVGALESEATAQTALGLYEARVIAQRHGGTLACWSRAGGGRELRLSIPLEPLGAASLGERLDLCSR